MTISTKLLTGVSTPRSLLYMETTTATDIQLGACCICKTVYRVESINGRIVTDLGGETAGYCGCRKVQGYTDTAVNFGKPVEVIYAPEVSCGGRCYTAKSATCKCSCKGEGHGQAHAA